MNQAKWKFSQLAQGASRAANDTGAPVSFYGACHDFIIDGEYASIYVYTEDIYTSDPFNTRHAYAIRLHNGSYYGDFEASFDDVLDLVFDGTLCHPLDVHPEHTIFHEDIDSDPSVDVVTFEETGFYEQEL